MRRRDRGDSGAADGHGLREGFRGGERSSGDEGESGHFLERVLMW